MIFVSCKQSSFFCERYCHRKKRVKVWKIFRREQNLSFERFPWENPIIAEPKIGHSEVKCQESFIGAASGALWFVTVICQGAARHKRREGEFFRCASISWKACDWSVGNFWDCKLWDIHQPDFDQIGVSVDIQTVRPKTTGKQDYRTTGYQDKVTTW